MAAVCEFLVSVLKKQKAHTHTHLRLRSHPFSLSYFAILKPQDLGGLLSQFLVLLGNPTVSLPSLFKMLSSSEANRTGSARCSFGKHKQYLIQVATDIC